MVNGAKWLWNAYVPLSAQPNCVMDDRSNAHAFPVSGLVTQAVLSAIETKRVSHEIFLCTVVQYTD